LLKQLRSTQIIKRAGSGHLSIAPVKERTLPALKIRARAEGLGEQIN